MEYGPRAIARLPRAITNLAVGAGEEDLCGLNDKKMVGVAVGSPHRCAAGAANVWCWGHNKYGQRGVGDKAARKAPIAQGR